MEMASPTPLSRRRNPARTSSRSDRSNQSNDDGLAGAGRAAAAEPTRYAEAARGEEILALRAVESGSDARAIDAVRRPRENARGGGPVAQPLPVSIENAHHPPSVADAAQETPQARPHPDQETSGEFSRLAVLVNIILVAVLIVLVAAGGTMVAKDLDGRMQQFMPENPPVPLLIVGFLFARIPLLTLLFAVLGAKVKFHPCDLFVAVTTNFSKGIKIDIPVQSPDWAIRVLKTLAKVAIRFGISGVSLSFGVLALHELAECVLNLVTLSRLLTDPSATTTILDVAIRGGRALGSCASYLALASVCISTLFMLLEAHDPLLKIFANPAADTTRTPDPRTSNGVGPNPILYPANEIVHTPVAGPADPGGSEQGIAPAKAPEIIDKRLKKQQQPATLQRHVVVTVNQFMILVLGSFLLTLIDSLPAALEAVVDVVIVALAFKIYMLSLSLLLDLIILRGSSAPVGNVVPAPPATTYILYESTQESFELFERLCVLSVALSGASLSLFAPLTTCTDCFPAVHFGLFLILARVGVAYMVTVHHKSAIARIVPASGVAPASTYGIDRKVHLLFSFLVLDGALTVLTAIHGLYTFAVDIPLITSTVLLVMTRSGMFLLLLTQSLKWYGNRPELTLDVLNAISYDNTLDALTNPGLVSSPAIVLAVAVGRLMGGYGAFDLKTKTFTWIVAVASIVSMFYLSQLTEGTTADSAECWSASKSSLPLNGKSTVLALNRLPALRMLNRDAPYSFCGIPWLQTPDIDVVDAALMMDISYGDTSKRDAYFHTGYREKPLPFKLVKTAAEINSTHESCLSFPRLAFFVSAGGSRTLYVAFRGTHLSHEWLMDAKIWFSQAVSKWHLAQLPEGVPWPSLLTADQMARIAYPLQPEKTLSDTIRQYYTDDSGVDQLECLLANIDNFLQKSKDARVILLGHSLGGGMAKRLASRNIRRSLNRTEDASRFDLRVKYLAINAPGFAENRLSHQLSAEDMIIAGININAHMDPISQVDPALNTQQTIQCAASSMADCHRLPFAICELWCACRTDCPAKCRLPSMSVSGRRSERPTTIDHYFAKLQQRFAENRERTGGMSEEDRTWLEQGWSPPLPQTYQDRQEHLATLNALKLGSSLALNIVMHTVWFGVFRQTFRHLHAPSAEAGAPPLGVPVGNEPYMPYRFWLIPLVAGAQIATAVVWRWLSGQMLKHYAGVAPPSIKTILLFGRGLYPLLGRVLDPALFLAPALDPHWHAAYYIISMFFLKYFSTLIGSAIFVVVAKLMTVGRKIRIALATPPLSWPIDLAFCFLHAILWLIYHILAILMTVFVAGVAFFATFIAGMLLRGLVYLQILLLWPMSLRLARSLTSAARGIGGSVVETVKAQLETGAIEIVIYLFLGVAIIGALMSP